jgi:hypothetical protein
VIQSAEPEWHFTPGHCTCPPLVSPQEKSSLGFWERKTAGSQREEVMMSLYAIPSQQEALDETRASAENTRKGTCRFEKNQIGDESYLMDCSAVILDQKTKYMGGPFTISVRKDNFIIAVSGDSQETLIRFANYALRQLPSSRLN